MDSLQGSLRSSVDPPPGGPSEVPGNGFPGWDVLVNGKSFDAFQPATRMLWEVKTNTFDDYTLFLKRTVLAAQLAEFQTDSALAKACGYDYTVGVVSAAHRDALLEASARTLNVVVMDWCAK